jgi:hypothetical protein
MIKIKEKMHHMRIFRVPLFNSTFFCKRSATVAEAEVNSKPECKPTPAANSTGGEEYRGVQLTDKGQQIDRFFTIHKLSDKKTDMRI